MEPKAAVEFEFGRFYAHVVAEGTSAVERRIAERDQVTVLYDRLGRGFEAIAVDAPKIVTKALGHRFDPDSLPAGLLGLSEGFRQEIHSGEQSRIERFDGFAQQIGVLDQFTLGEITNASGSVSTLVALELETSEGSLAAVARLGVVGASAGGALLLAAIGGLISLPLQLPEGERYLAQYAERSVGLELSDRFQVDQSNCAMSFGYELDVVALQRAFGDEYDYVAAEGDEVKRRACNLQIALTILGYEVGALDGIVGKDTKAAWRQFRLDRGMHVTRFDHAAYARLASDFSAQIARLRRHG